MTPEPAPTDAAVAGLDLVSNPSAPRSSGCWTCSPLAEVGCPRLDGHWRGADGADRQHRHAQGSGGGAAVGRTCVMVRRQRPLRPLLGAPAGRLGARTGEWGQGAQQSRRVLVRPLVPSAGAAHERSSMTYWSGWTAFDRVPSMRSVAVSQFAFSQVFDRKAADGSSSQPEPGSAAPVGWIH
jgi:hypothetical protein